MGILFKEILIYAVLFVLAALLVHPDLLSAPGGRLNAMGEKGNYFHPFVYVFLLYLLVALMRGVASLMLKLFRRLKGR